MDASPFDFSLRLRRQFLELLAAGPAADSDGTVRAYEAPLVGGSHLRVSQESGKNPEQAPLWIEITSTNFDPDEAFDPARVNRFRRNYALEANGDVVGRISRNVQRLPDGYRDLQVMGDGALKTYWTRDNTYLQTEKSVAERVTAKMERSPRLLPRRWQSEFVGATQSFEVTYGRLAAADRLAYLFSAPAGLMVRGVPRNDDSIKLLQELQWAFSAVGLVATPWVQDGTAENIFTREFRAFGERELKLPSIDPQSVRFIAEILPAGLDANEQARTSSLLEKAATMALAEQSGSLSYLRKLALSSSGASKKSAALPHDEANPMSPRKLMNSLGEILGEDYQPERAQLVVSRTDVNKVVAQVGDVFVLSDRSSPTNIHLLVAESHGDELTHRRVLPAVASIQDLGERILTLRALNSSVSPETTKSLTAALFGPDVTIEGKLSIDPIVVREAVQGVENEFHLPVKRITISQDGDGLSV